MPLLRKLSTFGASTNDLVHIYVLFVRSVLEASSSVWHKSLSQENVTDLERVQKSAFRIILGNEYSSYKNALNILKIETLKERRQVLFQNFCLKSLNIIQMNSILKEKKEVHIKNKRSKHIVNCCKGSYGTSETWPERCKGCMSLLSNYGRDHVMECCLHTSCTTYPFHVFQMVYCPVCM